MEREGNGGLAPPLDSDEYLTYMQWLFFAEGTFASRVTEEFRIKVIQGDGPNRDPMTRSGNKIVDSVDLFTFAEKFLSENEYFGGKSFSAADIMMHFPIKAGVTLGLIDANDYPHYKAWREKIEARPAFKRMREKSLPNGPLGIPKPLSEQKS